MFGLGSNIGVGEQPFGIVHPPLYNAETRQLGPRESAGGITKLHFDSGTELLWVGDTMGHLTSYAGLELDKYTAVQAHTTPIAAVVVHNDAVLSIGGEEMRVGTRQGVQSARIAIKMAEDLQSMIPARDRTGQIFVGGAATRGLSCVDVARGIELKMVDLDLNGVTIMKSASRSLCCGDSDGVVGLFDHRTRLLSSRWEAHKGPIADMDVGANTVVTCGFSYSNRVQQMVVEPFMKVYDLRYTKASQPIQYASGPSFLRFIPSPHYSSDQMIVVNQRLQFEQISISTGVSGAYPTLLNTAGSPCTCLEISQTGKVMAVGDADGGIHLLSAEDGATFTAAQEMPEFADEPFQETPINIQNMNESISFIPYEYCPERLLSEWEPHKLKVLHRPAPIIPIELQGNIRQSDFVGYAPNALGWKASHVPYAKDAVELRTPTRLKGGKQVTPGFARERKDRLAAGKAPAFKPNLSPMKRAPDLEGISDMIPKPYRRVDIKYSFLGIDDFDFAHYNRTGFCGLEIHIPNAYCNAMLQVLYFLNPVRIAAQRYWSDAEFDLISELGFLFHMLDQKPGRNCQASNFLRSFRTIPQASMLGLILNDDDQGANPSLQSLIQDWHRFMLTQIEYHTRAAPITAFDERKAAKDGGGGGGGKEGEEDGIPKQCSKTVFGNLQSSTSRCQTCNVATSRETNTLVHELRAPGQSFTDEELAGYTFADLLKDSMCRQDRSKAHCKSCKDYKLTLHTKAPTTLPNVLAINCNVNKENDGEFWGRKGKLHADSARAAKAEGDDGDGGDGGGVAVAAGESGGAEGEGAGLRATWLPHQVQMKLEGEGGLRVSESHDEALVSPMEDSDGTVTYELLATVAHVRDAKSNGNLVAHIKVGPAYNKLKEGISHTSWNLFNDFAVQPINKDEAVTYDMNWKVPCIMYYTRKGLATDATVNQTVEQPLSKFEECLTNDRSMAKMAQFQAPRIAPVKPSDMPGKGDLVAIDAEFVSLQKEEAEIRSDGHRSTIKPAHMACARVSLVYGSGPKKGEAFIDDYIKTSEPVADYLTKFSGVHPGDLDPGVSTKHLTTLKQTYCKIRSLELRGVIFVGHGLSKDFRVINISPPEKQVIDTVNIFHIRGRRKISLKYLTWKVLGQRMQMSEFGHDSVEDSRAALALYDKHVEIKAGPNGGSDWNEFLQTLYSEGQQVQFKVPPL